MAGSRLRQPVQPEPVVEKPKPVEVPKVEAKEVKAEAKPETKKPIKVKEVGGRRWWLAGLGAGGVILGIAAFMLYASTQNMILGVIAVGSIIGGCVCIYYGWKVQEPGIVVINEAGKKVGGKTIEIHANSLNIYDGKIAFEELKDEELKGIPRKCLNDNKFYHVHIWDTAFNNPHPEGKLLEFKLPDTQYRDPREFSLNLRIPAHRRLAQRKASLMEKISPWILIVGIVIVGIIWVATTPAKGG